MRARTLALRARGRVAQPAQSHALTSLAAIVAALLLSSGCALQVGARTGLSTVEDPARFAAAGRVTAMVMLPRVRGVGGIEVDGAARGRIGATWSLGLTGGYRIEPDASAGTVGFELLGHLGARVDDSTLRLAKEWYGGLSFGFPCAIGVGRSGADDYNGSLWIAHRAIELVPFVSALYRRVPDSDGGRVGALELTVGLTLRLRVATDLL